MIELHPLILAIEEASGLNFEQIEAEGLEPWIGLYREELAVILDGQELPESLILDKLIKH